jgi:tetratricopeptide (TPR) repeat protein
VAALRTVARQAILALAVVCLAVGGLALAGVLLPDAGWVAAAQGAVVGLALQLSAAGAPVELSGWLESAFGNPLVQWGLAPVGLLALIGALLPGRGAIPPPAAEGDPRAAKHEEFVLPVEKKVQRKAARQAAGLSRAGRAAEAGELCFQNGLMEQAAQYFIEGGERIRAAEIRHDQNRFLESAELYIQAGSHATAGAIFAQQSEWKRAGEAYLKAGNQSVAGEMFEKAEEWRKAAECYQAADFPRHAARAWVKCSEWRRAAECLEIVIVENMTGAGSSDAKRQAETKKLVRMAGDLFGRAGNDEKAQAIFTRGECWAEAAEIALRAGRAEQAAELFLKARDAQRASKVLSGLGREADAERVLAEHHRDRGEDELAARHFERAGEWMAAGDLYRMLERVQEAGACYEKQGDFAQAAEMFRAADDRERAAANYERAGLHAQAAECWALLGDAAREAQLLSKAGEFLRAGELLHRGSDDDEAIKVLQQVGPEHADFPRASAILGEIFRQRGNLSLAQKTLSQAVQGAEVTRDTVQAWFGLASVQEASGSAREALEIYEKILAFDYQRADAAEGATRCKERVAAEERDKPRGDSDGPGTGSTQKGRYEIVGKLGRGGMGIVYKAQDTVLDRVVAFKVLPETLKENPQALKNFLREAKSAAQLNHPNIVQVYDAGEQDGQYYIAMEYVDGNTLKEIVKARGRISAGGILHVLVQMCEGLAYAHDKKIVHRDVKTANTMWTRDRKAKIMDFGLAKVVEEVRNHTTVVSGTPYYMSPEQTLGKNVDHRTDLYSLGVTLFELATGTLPFREGNLPYHHVHTPPPDPREFASDLPEAIVNVIDRCLQKDPADRYGSAREILEELRASMKT